MIGVTVPERSSGIKNTATRLDVTYYTDPLCCWSWAMEAHWRKVQDKFCDVISVRYCMGGLIESWNNYCDTENAVSKPIQMGPVWMQAAHIGNVAIDNALWVKDPPASSYLACVAIKSAFMQSFLIGEQFLRLLRKEVMENGKNISKLSIIQSLAVFFQNQHSDFDLARFNDDLLNGSGNQAFANDLQEVRYRNISRLPSLSISNGERGILLTGYRPYEAILEAVEKLAIG
jgi:putative protein-disulfide isomerase